MPDELTTHRAHVQTIERMQGASASLRRATTTLNRRRAQPMNASSWAAVDTYLGLAIDDLLTAQTFARQMVHGITAEARYDEEAER